jgi:AcrR family transcriptional regulator
MKTYLGLTQHEDRMHGSDGRPVRTAASHFAAAGLRGTTISMLVNAAGIPEGTLYAHFGTKERLFREAVRNNIDARLQIAGGVLAFRQI